jgi:predicted type IV restriction endonuclease
LAYAYHAGVNWCVLTNGWEWRLYKTMAPGDASSRLFRVIRLNDIDAPSFLALLMPVALGKDEAGRLWDAENAERLVRPVLCRSLDVI